MRRFACIPALLALALLTAPAPAGAAEVGRQVERRAPAVFPENIGGCAPQRCLRGRRIPRRWVLLSRNVRLEKGESRTPVRFACPGGRRFRTFGHLEGRDVFIGIPDDQFPYTSRTRVRMLGRRNLTPLSQPASGTLYAICVPR